MMGNVSPIAEKIVDAMCHAAICDGQVAESELKIISTIAKKLTNTYFDHTTLIAIIDRAEKTASIADFNRLALGLNTEQSTMMMRAVLHVIAADGRLEGNELTFVGGLAKALKMTGGEVQTMLAEITS